MVAALFGPEGVRLGVYGGFWFMVKVLGYLYAFLWIRFTFPRYRFDQLMRLGWRFLIPLALVNLIAVATAKVASQEWGWYPRITMILATIFTLGVALWLASRDTKQEPAVEAAGGD
jgi:NADH-quinone oxidoreductase subunit H